eukprot:COSAG05_NODE_1795_length_4077_cov_2.741830_1_plen_182_part_00
MHMKKRQDGFVPRSHSRGHNSPIRRSPTRHPRYDGDKQLGAQKTRSHIEQAEAPLVSTTDGWRERVQQYSRQSSPLANASSAAARGRRKGSNSPGARRSPLQRDHPDAHRSSGTRAHHHHTFNNVNNNAAAGFTEPLLIFPASGSPHEGLSLGYSQPNPDTELATAIEVVDWQQKQVSTPF